MACVTGLRSQQLPDRGFKSPQPTRIRAWAYVVQNLDGHFYIGMTTDLEARIRDLAGSDHQTRSWGVTEHSASRVPKELLTSFSGQAQTTLLDRQQRNIRYFMGRLQPEATDDGGSGNEYMIVKELYRQRIFFPPPVRNFVPGQIVACPQKAL
jgi:hypothetical protein